MAYSFVAVREPSGGLLNRVEAGLSGRVDTIEAENWRILVSGSTHDRSDYLSVDKTTGDYCLLVGDIANLEEVRAIAAIYCSDAVSAAPVDVLAMLVDMIGPSAAALVEGPFSFVRFECGGNVVILTDALGLQPVHVIFGRQMWIGSELKAIGLADPDIFEFKDEEDVLNDAERSDDYTPIRNGVKAKPGAVTTIRGKVREAVTIDKRSYVEFRLGPPQRISLARAQDAISQLLSNMVARMQSADADVAIPLSGGLDSSMITAFAARSGQRVHTYSIGTRADDEFRFSRRVADFLGTTHRELLIDEADIMNGVNNAIYYNEIFDGLSAEIQSGLVCLYKAMAGRHKRVLTGYGADLLFGGVLSPGTASAAVNGPLQNLIYRTRWTGEFSSFCAIRHGLLVTHPFWTPRLIGFAMNLAPDLKVSDVEVKVALRSCADMLDLLPQDIIRRPKIGIHEGSSVNRLFAEQIGAAVSDYKAKTRYAYRVFRRAIAHRMAPEESAPTLNLAPARSRVAF